MNRSKKLAALVGVLVVVCGAAFAVTKYEEHKENIKNSDTVILKLDADSVTALSWENSTTELSFHKDGKWVYDEDEAFPVDEEKVNDLLEVFKKLEASFIIEDVEDYGQYGLEDPVCSIQITSGGQEDEDKDKEEEAEPLEITLGDFSKMDSQRYVSIGDGNVYLVKDDPLDQFSAELADMIQNDEVPELEEADKIIFSGDIAYQINREEESGKSYQEDDVYFVNDKNNDLPLDTSLVDDYLSTVSDAGLTTYVTYDATEDELASYGLDSPDLSLTIDYSYENEEEEEVTDTFVLHISRDPEEKEAAGDKAEEDAADEEDAKAAEEADEDTEEDSGEEETVTAYARVGDSQIVYKLDGNIYQALMKASYNDLRHQNIYYGDFDDVTQIDITLEGDKYTITSEKKGDERTYSYEDKELDVTDLESSIESLKASEFTEEEADGKEEIRIKLHTENEDFSTIEIVMYRYDGETCLAEVNGDPVAYVSRGDVVDLIEAVNAIVL